MTRLSHLTLRNFLIALHDLLATAAALFAAFYLRFEGGDGFFDRLPLLFQILPYFLAFSVVVFFIFNLTTTKWRFISLPDALNIIRVATVLTVALLVLDYIFVAPNVRGAFFLGKVTIVLYWFLEISFLSALRMAYRYFRYTRVRRHARGEEAAPTLLIGRAADAEVLLRGIESGRSSASGRSVCCRPRPPTAASSSATCRCWAASTTSRTSSPTSPSATNRSRASS